jgi:hypothetical protein
MCFGNARPSIVMNRPRAMMNARSDTMPTAPLRMLVIRPLRSPRSNEPLIAWTCLVSTPMSCSQDVASAIRSSNWSWYVGSSVANRAAEMATENARPSNTAYNASRHTIVAAQSGTLLETHRRIGCMTMVRTRARNTGPIRSWSPLMPTITIVAEASPSRISSPLGSPPSAGTAAGVSLIGTSLFS